MIKRTTVGLVIVLVVAVGGFIIWRTVTKEEPSVSTQPTATVGTQESPQNNQQQTSTTPAQPAKYVTYSSADVAADKNTKLLFFHAPWCPQCRALDTDITKSITSESGLSVYKVDYDSNQALRQKYGVTLQTTVVRIDDAGNLVEKYVAYNEPTFANVKANLL